MTVLTFLQYLIVKMLRLCKMHPVLITIQIGTYV